MKGLTLLMLLLAVGCANYPYASKVKMVSFDDNLEKGQASGNIRGEDCTWKVLGYELGSKPTLDRAFINAKNQASTTESAGFTSGKSQSSLRYVMNVTTKAEGFNAAVVGKDCLVVTGVGYR